MSQLEFQDAFEPYYADPAHNGSMSDRDDPKPVSVVGLASGGDLKSCQNRLVAVRSRLAKLVARSVEGRSEQARSEQFN